ASDNESSSASSASRASATTDGVGTRNTDATTCRTRSIVLMKSAHVAPDGAGRDAASDGVQDEHVAGGEASRGDRVGERDRNRRRRRVPVAVEVDRGA